MPPSLRGWLAKHKFHELPVTITGSTNRNITTLYRHHDSKTTSKMTALVEAQFKMLCKEVSRYKAMFPDCNDTAVVDGKAEFC